MQDPVEQREERAFRTPDARGPEGETVKPAAKARQGLSSKRVMIVLVVALALVIIGFILSFVIAI